MLLNWQKFTAIWRRRKSDVWVRPRMAMSPCRTRRPFLSQLTAFLDLDSVFWAWKIFQEAYEPHTIPMHRTLFIFYLWRSRMEWAYVSDTSSEVVLPSMMEQRCTAMLGKEAVLDKPHQAVFGIRRLLPASTSKLPIGNGLGKGG